jgi:hypothetical protein
VRKLLILAASLAALVAPTAAMAAPAAQSIDRGKFNYNTHRYIVQVRGCISATRLVASIAQKTNDDVELADATTKGRDICDAIRSRLLSINTDHFDNQASQAWYGVDRMKSGLNALLVYIDSKAPSKVIEARDKLVQGLATAQTGNRAINARRLSFGLRAI